MAESVKQSEKKNGVVLEKQKNLKTISYANKHRNFGGLFQNGGMYDKQEQLIYNGNGTQEQQNENTII